MSSAPDQLDPCGCCEAAIPRPSLTNRPGLPTLAYRITTHAASLRRMLARLPIQSLPDDPSQQARPLAALTTRALNDPAIALLDAWAVTADVLTFYQERIANEGFLRTATERRSILELARTIGYELRPGVAANTFLAFTVEDAPGAPGQAIVPPGTKVQSVPGQGQLPQTFETGIELLARAEWNTLRPRLSQPQQLALKDDDLWLLGDTFDPSDPAVQSIPAAQVYPVGDTALDASAIVNAVKTARVYVAGTTASIKAGELLLLVGKRSAADLQTRTVRVREVVIEGERGRTRLELDLTAPVARPPRFVVAFNPSARISPYKLALNATQVERTILSQSFSESSMTAFLAIQGWQTAAVLSFIATPKPAPPPPDTGVFAFRARLGFFGHNAPRFIAASNPGLNDWDTNGGRAIWTNSQGTAYSDADAFLERSVPEITRNSWAVFERPASAPTAFRVADISDESLADYGLSAKTSGLSLLKPNGDSLGSSDKSSDFKVRKTTAHVQSEQLTLAQMPIEEPVARGSLSLPLDRMVLGLQIGQPLALNGERDDLPGVRADEIVIVANVVHSGGFTTLFFTDPLQNSYVRKTITLNANVVPATHGETINEVLGSGDGAQPNQRFTLKKPPLTYTSAATASGAQSTLLIRVNGVAWAEAPRLYGADARDESYIVRIEDDGKTSVIFGDGAMGARLPTGTENVVARYRSGIGLAGMVGAGKLTLLQTRPLGIRGVTNPLPAADAADPENRDSARTNAPLTVLTLDRIVSLQDFEDFARAFAGIGKAQAIALWLGATHLAHITVASAAGTIVAPNSPLYANLVAAMDAARDPGQPFKVESYQPLFFDVAAKLLIDPRYDSPTVLAAAQAALLAAFSFARRQFGQAVTAAEVVSVIQGVAGVIATDLDALYLVTSGSATSASLAARLPAASATWDAATRTIQPAQLLLINPAGITLGEMSA